MLELAKFIHRWPTAVINHMTWRQREIELMRKVAKPEFRRKHLMPCTFCGIIIKSDMYRHVARRHLQLAQLWRCPVSWCTVWRGLMDHILDGHNVPREIKRASLRRLFPPWTVTRERYAESLSAQHSGISNDVLLFSEVGLSLVHHYRVHKVGRPHAMFRGKYLAQLLALLPAKTMIPTTGGPSSTAGPPAASTTSRTDGLCATPRPPGRRQRPQGQIQDTPTQIAPQLTEQDPRMAAGAVVFDCHPALLPVSVDVSGIDMRAVRSAISPAESVVVSPELEQQFGGAPMVISPVVPLLPAQVEEDVDLAQILAEFGTLPAIVTPINDPQEEREMPPAEYRPPEVPADVFVNPAGPDDGVGRPPTGSVGRSPSALVAPAVPTPERNLLFPGQTWIGPPSGGETADYRLPTVPLPSRATAVSQPVNVLNTLRERANVPDLSREGPFDIHRDRLHPDASLRSCQDSQGCPFRITSYDLEIDGSDFSPEYGVQLHDPRLLEYVGAPESARLLSRSPEYWVQHMGKEKTLSAALQLQHDDGLILSNVQVSQQLVTALHGASANMMGLSVATSRFRLTQCGTHCLLAEFAGQPIT